MYIHRRHKRIDGSANTASKGKTRPKGTIPEVEVVAFALAVAFDSLVALPSFEVVAFDIVVVVPSLVALDILVVAVHTFVAPWVASSSS